MKAMPNYYVEGLFATRLGVKKKQKTGSYPPSSIEPYAKTIWANSPKEAIQIATGELLGGAWIEGPHVSLHTEEQRMRSMGAAEFPGLSAAPRKRRKG
jgi:hypothetical protein